MVNRKYEDKTRFINRSLLLLKHFFKNNNLLLLAAVLLILRRTTSKDNENSKIGEKLSVYLQCSQNLTVIKNILFCC